MFFQRAAVVVALLGVTGGCRMQSIEYVGKAGKSLAAYTEPMADTASLCQLQTGKPSCPSADATDELVSKSLTMLAEYGAGLEKLSGKKSVGVDKLVEGGLTLNKATEWVDLGSDGPDAIKKGAGLIDKLIAGGIQRKAFEDTHAQLGDTMAALEQSYKDVLAGQLEYICLIGHTIRENKTLLEQPEIACPPGSNAACDNQRKLSLMSADALLVDLGRRRASLYEAGAGVALFLAAHEALGELIRSNGKSDKQVVAAMKDAGTAAKDAMKAYLEAQEAAIEACDRSEP